MVQMEKLSSGRRREHSGAQAMLRCAPVHRELDVWDVMIRVDGVPHHKGLGWAARQIHPPHLLTPTRGGGTLKQQVQPVSQFSGSPTGAQVGGRCAPEPPWKKFNLCMVA